MNHSFFTLFNFKRATRANDDHSIQKGQRERFAHVRLIKPTKVEGFAHVRLIKPTKVEGFAHLVQYRLYYSYRRRLNTEAKAKVVAAVWGTECIQFLTASASLYKDDFEE